MRKTTKSVFLKTENFRKNNHNIYTAYIDVDLSFTQETLARSKADAESYFNQLTLADIISLLKEKESLKTNPSLECEIEIVHDSVQKISGARHGTGTKTLKN